MGRIMGYDTGRQMSALSPRLIALISKLEAYDDLSRGADPDKTYLYQVSAAMKAGVFEPFNAEQTALNDFLSRIGAGKELTHKAWQLYVQDVKNSA